MRLIVGLGNPGEKYKGTRHNFGRKVVGRLAKEMGGTWSIMKKFQSETSRYQPGVILAKPTVFMNQSGQSVKKLVHYFKLKPTDLWLIHDDVDLPLGEIKIQKGRGAAGHHGVESVINQLGSRDFVRVRLGIGRPMEKVKKKTKEGVERFVLSKFFQKEKAVINQTIELAVKTIKKSLEEETGVGQPSKEEKDEKR